MGVLTLGDLRLGAAYMWVHDGVLPPSSLGDGERCLRCTYGQGAGWAASGSFGNTSCLGAGHGWLQDSLASAVAYEVSGDSGLKLKEVTGGGEFLKQKSLVCSTRTPQLILTRFDPSIEHFHSDLGMGTKLIRLRFETSNRTKSGMVTTHTQGPHLRVAPMAQWCGGAHTHASNRIASDGAVVRTPESRGPHLGSWAGYWAALAKWIVGQGQLGEAAVGKNPGK
jgi:hypothetical protein